MESVITMTYEKLKASVEEQLSKNVMRVVFTKKNGEERTMFCTRDFDLLEKLNAEGNIKGYTTPKQVGNRATKVNDKLVIAYDLVKDAFRTFDIRDLKDYGLSSLEEAINQRGVK